MGDRRIVQCFGTKKRPGKPDKDCRRKFLWTARGSSGNFGSKGIQNCPHCGTMPDFQHPFNQYLNGEITHEQAEAAMPAYLEKLYAK
jgi:hypothetical protein